LSTPTPEDISGLRKWLGQQGEKLARHDAQIEALEISTARLEAAVGELRAEMRDTRTELKADMQRGFERLESAVGAANERAHEALSPEAAMQLASANRAAGANRAWAIALLAALVTLAAVTAALWVR